MLSSLRSTSALRIAFFSSLFALAASGLFAGCAQEGTTPQCENNVTKDGILIHKTDKPCESFGRCYINDQEHPAKDCCVDDKGDPLTGEALALCLYGFGEVDLASAGGGGSGGSTGGSGGTTTTP